MAIFVDGKRMPEWYKPELYDDEDINNIVKELYENCRVFQYGCESCPCNGELDGESCKADIIMELWRKWHNAEAALNEKEDNSKKENSQGVLEP